MVLCGVVLKDRFGKGSIAGSDFDDGERGQGFEPFGDGFSKNMAEGCGGGEVAVFADILDFGGVVAEVGMIEGGFHEFFEGKRGIAWRKGFEEEVAGRGHGPVLPESLWGKSVAGAFVVVFDALFEVCREACVAFVWVGEALDVVYVVHGDASSFYSTTLYRASKDILHSLSSHGLPSFGEKDGVEDRTRTGDPLNHNQVL